MSDNVFEMPVFIELKTVKKIEEFLELCVDNNLKSVILDYRQCEGVSDQNYFLLKQLLIDFKLLNNISVKEKNIKKRLMKLFRTIEKTDWIDG